MHFKHGSEVLGEMRPGSCDAVACPQNLAGSQQAARGYLEVEHKQSVCAFQRLVREMLLSAKLKSQ